MNIFKSYDIRGIYDTQLTQKDAYLIGYYLSKYLSLKKIKIAHDMRLSHDSLAKFLMQGLIDCGCEVIYEGAISTPNFYYSLFEGVNSGILITASHNPKEYNGFKIINELNSVDMRNGLEIIKKLVENDMDNKKNDFLMTCDSINNISLEDFINENEIEHKKEVLEDYVNFLYDYYLLTLNDDERKVLKNIKFAMDFSSGMSSNAIIPFIEKTGLKCRFLNYENDGNFPIHSPDPIKAAEFIENSNLKDCIFTAVFDGDGDRIIFYDENKKLILQDHVIFSLIKYFAKNGHKDFVCDLRISKGVIEYASKNNLNLKLIRVGRAYYKDYMDNNSCVFGAELSGHIFFRDFHNLDNPDIALIHILKLTAISILENTFNDFSHLIKAQEKYYKLPEKNLRIENKNIIDNLKEKFKKNLTSEIDGASFDFGDYWFNIRSSNTESLVRINLEGIDKETSNNAINELGKILI